MSLVDLISDLSKFRSDVSKESKNTPEASKAKGSKNFATLQPITEKLSQFSLDIKKSETTQTSIGLEERDSKFDTRIDKSANQSESSISENVSKFSKKDTVKKFLDENLIVNRVSQYSNINESFQTRNLGLVTTEQVTSKFSIQTTIEDIVTTDPRVSNLDSSDVIVVKKENGISDIVTELNVTNTGAFSNKLSIPTEQGLYNSTDQSIFSLYQKKPVYNSIPKSQSINIPTEINNIPYGGTTNNTGKIQNPNIDIKRSTLSFDKESQSPNLASNVTTNGLTEQTNNIEIPTININKIEQTIDRSSTTPEIKRNFDDPVDNIENPNILVERKPLFSDVTSRTPSSIFKIVKTRDDQTNNIVDPKIDIDKTKTDGIVVNPNLDILRSDLLSKQLDDNSKLNLDNVVRTNPTGRNDDPTKSDLSTNGTQEVNFFNDSNAKGFKSKSQQGQTYYEGKSKYGWHGSSAPAVNFISDTNGKGFAIFAGSRGTQFNTDSSIFGFTTIPEVDFFDIKKEYTKDGFSSFVRQFDTSFKQDSSVFTFKGNSKSAPTVDYFDRTKKVTKSGFDKFVQPYNSFYIADASSFTWKGNSNNSPQVDYFDVTKKVTTIGFHRFARIFDTKYKSSASEFDWDGTKQNAPQVNYFDVSKKYTTTGFHKFANIYDSKYIKDSSEFDWNGSRINAPEVNYFDLTKKNTTAGFHKFSQILDTKYKKDSSQFDWDGLRNNAPEVNYFDISKKFTNAGFHKFARILDTKYIKDSSQFDWNGLRKDAPEVNYFDISKKFTDAGFHKFANLLDTKYKKDSSQFDWNGLRPDAPQVNYFDITKQFTTAGFHKFAALYDSKYIADSSQFDWDGLRPDAPEVDYFDITNQFTTSGFHKFAALYDTKYTPDSSQFDWDGINPKTDAPEVDFFDITKQFTSTGFHRFAALYDSKYIADSSQFDWDGTYPRTDAPEVNYFDLLNQFTTAGFHKFARPYESMYIKDSSFFDWDGTRVDAPEVNYFDPFNIHTLGGFHKFAQIYDTKYKPEASRFDWEGTRFDAPEVDYFDITKQFTNAGFHRLAALYDSKYIADSSQFNWDGTRVDAPEVNYFDPFNIHTLAGFHKFAQIYDTKYKPEASRFDWEGSSQDAPEVNYFDVTSRYTSAGFHRLAQLYDSKYLENASQFDWDGLRANAPEVDYFDITNQFTTKGFHVFAPLYDSKFIKDSSRFDWDGLRANAPSVDYFRIAGSNIIPGFTTFFNDVTATKLDDDFSRFSFAGTNRISSVRNAPYTNFFGFTPTQRTGFMVAMTDRNHSLYPILEPRLLFDADPLTRNSIVNIRGSQKPLRTTNNFGNGFVPSLNGLFWFDGLGNSGIATLERQVPIVVKTNAAAGSLVNKYGVTLKNNTQDLGYLTKWATTRRSASPLDNQYNKYKLQNESTNLEPAFFYQPYVVRGIQRDGEVENQRWGFGATFDDGIVRGGVITQAERILQDVFRIGKWTLSVKGLMFNIKQLGLQAMNPSVDVDPRTPTSGIFGVSATLGFNPLSIIGNIATARAGAHFARHGINPLDSDYLNKYEQATKNRELDQRFLSTDKKQFENLESPIAPGQQTSYNRLIGLMKELLPNSFQPTINPDQNASIKSAKDALGRSEINRLSSIFGGAQSYFGIGGTIIRKSSHPYLVSYTTSPNLDKSVKKGGAFLAGAASGVGLAEIGLNIAAAANVISQQQPQYEDSAKRNISFAYNYTYYDDYKDKTEFQGFLSSLIKTLTEQSDDLFGGSGQTNSAADSVHKDTVDKIKKINPLDPSGRTLSSRGQATTALNADSHLNEDYMLGEDVLFSTDSTYADAYKSPETRDKLTLVGLVNQLTKQKDENAPDDESDEIIGIQDSTKEIVKALNPLNPQYRLPSDRVTRVDNFNASSVINENNPLSKELNSNFPYRTVNYDKLKKGDRPNSRLFNDFREDIELDGSSKTHMSDPVVINFNENNLTRKYGFGKHGKVGVERDKPYVTNICYEDSNIPGVYAVPVEKNINGKQYEFRGDRINLIDYKRARFNINKSSVYEKDQTIGIPGADDLIEFYFTGVSLKAQDAEDSRVIVFRASFDSINDNHNPTWSPVKYFGRGDPLYVYGGYERDIQFGFTVYIGSRDELKAVWRKLNFLASWTAPRYLQESKHMAGPITRLNIGHLYRKMPGFISSLSYTFDNQVGTWETAGLIEDQDISSAEIGELSKFGALQLPKYIQVSVSFVPFGVYRPQYEGAMYSLFDDSVDGQSSGFEDGISPGNDLTKINYFRHFDCDSDPNRQTQQTTQMPGQDRTDTTEPTTVGTSGTLGTDGTQGTQGSEVTQGTQNNRGAGVTDGNPSSSTGQTDGTDNSNTTTNKNPKPSGKQKGKGKPNKKSKNNRVKKGGTQGTKRQGNTGSVRGMYQDSPN